MVTGRGGIVRLPPSAAERRRQTMLIGLSIGSVLVLLLGIIAIVIAGDDDTATVSSSTTAPTSTVVSTSTVAPTTVPASTTTTAAPSTTVVLVPGIADAGADISVDAGSVVTLEAVEITQGATDDDVQWRQTVGPDVTGGVGALGGSVVSFGAPDDVVTLGFELVVGQVDGAFGAEEAVDDLLVRVFEDADNAVFVDGDTGDDAGPGTLEEPLRTIGAAARAAVAGGDVYVRSGPTYVEIEAVRLGRESNLYGGFGEGWTRDTTRRARLEGASTAVVLQGDGVRRLSAFELIGSDAAPGDDAVAVLATGGEIVSIEDSRVLSGAAGVGLRDEVGTAAPGGVSAGVSAFEVGELRIERSTVNAGPGGAGASAGDGAARRGATAGADGNDVAGGLGSESVDDRRGGDGGDGGVTGDGRDGGGDRGGDGGDTPGSGGQPGDGGPGGAGGIGGNGGGGVADSGPVGADGDSGAVGSNGMGGGGGGGGAAAAGLVLAAGGGGGGGGGGGLGGVSGLSGGGGGGSVGILADRVEAVVVVESLVAPDRGGDGGAGGRGGAGASGGAGGRGATGEQQAGPGGGGGGGGAAGDGGAGGGGAGGPSFGLYTADVDDVIVTASTVRGGVGGRGADGGLGGASGAEGRSGVGRDGGTGGDAGVGEQAAQGAGAAGGASFGWFDAGNAVATFDDADFVEGTAGPGGIGSTRGENGVEADVTADRGR